MKKQIMILIFVVLLTLVNLNGCVDNSSIPLNKVVSLDSLSLDVGDLPEGYNIWSESYNLSVAISSIVSPLDIYDIVFIYGESGNFSGFPLVQLTLTRFNSSDYAEIVLQNSTEMMSKILNTILNLKSIENIEQVGNKSIYKLYQGLLGDDYENQSATWSFIYFRIDNILAYLLVNEIPTSEIDYVNLTMKYAKIVEERINSHI